MQALLTAQGKRPWLHIAIAAGLATALVLGVLVIALHTAPTAPAQMRSRPTSRIAASAVPALADPHEAGATLLRLSNKSPRIGGELSESGTSAFQSRLVSHPSGQVLMTITCYGGDSLLVVGGPSGLSDGDFITIDCPATQPTVIRTVLSAQLTRQRFRLIVYERFPSTWKLLLSSYPAT